MIRVRDLMVSVSFAPECTKCEARCMPLFKIEAEVWTNKGEEFFNKSLCFRCILILVGLGVKTQMMEGWPEKGFLS